MFYGEGFGRTCQKRGCRNPIKRGFRFCFRKDCGPEQEEE